MASIDPTAGTHETPDKKRSMIERRRSLPLSHRLMRLRYALERLRCRLPLPQMPLPACRGTALVLQPGDSWPGEAARGRDLLQGQFRFAGRTIDLPEPLWEPAGASDAWLAALHGFSWLRDLRSAGGDGARRLARDLTRDWLERYGELWSAPAWEPSVLARRILACLTQYEYFAATAEPALQSALIESLGRQARCLQRQLPAGLVGVDLLAAIKAILFAAFCLPGGKALRVRGETLLLRELRRQISDDGGQIERCPSRLAGMLRDLIDLRALYSAAEEPAPEELEQAMLRVAPLLKSLRHGDGTLALFNGSREEESWYIDLLLQRSAMRGKSAASAGRSNARAAPQAGFHRLQSGRSLLLVDGAAPPPPGFDEQAHAGTLSFEMSVGREHLIVNCGGHANHTDLNQLLRGTAAHSTLSINDINSSVVLSGGGLGYRPGDVSCRREESEGNVWLEMSHDGYAKRLGLLHQRRLFLASGGDDLRGEDRVAALPGRQSRPNADTAVLRFHLHPDVAATQLQGGNVLLRLKRGGGWRFRQTGGELTLEPSLYSGSGEGPPRQCEQIVIRAPLSGKKSVVKWSLKREQKPS
ncbi:heparinase II/III family protein [Limibacillus sp. MBR-115]|uniref:heparinase II/III family protein n=1 Tax=Limibacillus sp. MBR-115 TaxID=3156465 RepID=UPI00339267A6